MSQLPKPHLSDINSLFIGELPTEVSELYEIAFNYLVYMIFEMGGKLEVDAKLVLLFL
jgi:hypothetical protein